MTSIEQMKTIAAFALAGMIVAIAALATDLANQVINWNGFGPVPGIGDGHTIPVSIAIGTLILFGGFFGAIGYWFRR